MEVAIQVKGDSERDYEDLLAILHAREFYESLRDARNMVRERSRVCELEERCFLEDLMEVLWTDESD